MAPEFGKPIHHLPLIPVTVKNIASMSRSIRGSGNLLSEAPTRRLQPFRLKRRGYVLDDVVDGCVEVCRRENPASHRYSLSGSVRSGNAGFSEVRPLLTRTQRIPFPSTTGRD
jgi:hypothetical protein